MLAPILFFFFLIEKNKQTGLLSYLPSEEGKFVSHPLLPSAAGCALSVKPCHALDCVPFRHVCFFVLLDFPVRWNVTNVRTPLSLRRSSGSLSIAASSNGAEQNLTCVEPLQTVQWNWVVGAKCLSTSREMWKSGVLFLSPIRLVISCCQGTSCA